MSSKVIIDGKKYRIFNNELKQIVGPSFNNLKDAENFISWYDGNTSYIDTWLDERDWDQILDEWSKQHHTNNKKKIQNQNQNKSLKKLTTMTGTNKKKRTRTTEPITSNKRHHQLVSTNNNSKQEDNNSNNNASQIDFTGIFKKIEVC